MRIELTSFGFLHGRQEADTVLDVRCLENPYWVHDLRDLCGLDPEVQHFVLDNEIGRNMFNAMLCLLLLQASQAERRTSTHRTRQDCLRVAIGCSGGQHRSVAMAEALARALSIRGLTVRVLHRDLHLDYI